MFVEELGFWEQIEHSGTEFYLLLTAILTLLAVAYLCAAIRTKNSDATLPLAVRAMIFTVFALFGWSLVLSPDDSIQHDIIEDQITAQIEEHYEVKVEDFVSYTLNGDGKMSDITEVYGIFEAKRIAIENGQWLEPEFKFYMKQGEDIVLYPVTAPNAEYFDPAKLKK